MCAFLLGAQPLLRDQACTSLRSRSADLAKPMIMLGMALFQAKSRPGPVEGYLIPCLQVRQTTGSPRPPQAGADAVYGKQ